MNDDATLRARKTIRTALVLAGLQVGGALLLTIAHRVFGWIDSETVTRGVMVLIGVMLVLIGNAMPKQHEGPPAQSVADIIVRQSINRVGGWALMLSGIVWIGLWAIAERGTAEVLGVAAVIAAMLVTGAHSLWRYRAHRRAS